MNASLWCLLSIPENMTPRLLENLFHKTHVLCMLQIALVAPFSISLLLTDRFMRSCGDIVAAIY